MDKTINDRRLDELRALDEDGSHSTLNSLIGMFLESMPKKFNELKDIDVSKELSKVRAVAHSLRSSALNIGAERLATACQEIEYETDIHKIQVLLPKVERSLHEALAELGKELDQKEENFEQLNQIIQLQQEVATSNYELKPLMDLICREAQKITNANGAVVELADGDEMVYEACSGSVLGQNGLRLRIRSSLSGSSVLQNKVLYCKDSETDSRVDKEACLKVHARSMICVPLIHKNRAIGVLKVLSDKPDHFKTSDVNALKIVTGLLSASMAQARALGLLTESEQKYRALVESANDGISVSQEGVIIEVNRQFEILFGYPKSEIIGMEGWLLIVPEFRDEVRNRIRGGYSLPYDTTCQRKDGSRFEAEITGKMVEVNGKPARVTTVRDVSAKKVVEKNLIESERMSREATLTKSQFLANMSHEIRTPLNGIIGMASILEDTTLDTDQKQYVGVLKKSADNLLHIINDILDFSKIEAKKLHIENIPFDIKSTVNDLVPMLNHAAAKNKVKLSIEYDAALPATLMGDPSRLAQVVTNLASNAIKFTKEGTVEIEVKKTMDNKLRINVSDSGIGIPKAALKDLFTAFSQVDASTTRKYGGTGLGLSICKQLVEMMDGKIGVESEVGHGSLFWFELPLIEAKATPKALVDAPVIRTNKKLHILLVEDNNINLTIAKIMVEGMGHTVGVARNGKEAIKALEVENYDLVLMDCQMPEMDGFEATQYIRKSDQKWKSIPIIAMTAYAMEGDREKCLDAGMDDYTTKPIRKQELLNVIDRTAAKL